MKAFRVVTAMLIAGLVALSASVAGAEQPAVNVTVEELDALRRQIQELSDKVERLEAQAEAGRQAAEAVHETSQTRTHTPRVSIDQGGFRVRSEDEAFEFRIRARLATDFGWFRQSRALKYAIGDEQDGVDFRTARLRLQGRAWHDLTYLAEFDFAGQSGEDTPKFRDVYIQYSGIPYWGDNAFDFRVGHFKEPIGLDVLYTFTDRVFMENPLLAVFIPSRNFGVQISDALLGDPGGERLTWSLGLFKETDEWPSSNDSDEDQGWQVTGRLTGLPYYAHDGRRLIHLGAAYSRRNPDGASLGYGVRPESRLSRFRYLNPDALPPSFRLRDARADNVNLYGLEAGAVFGPFSAQGEYVLSEVDTTFGGRLEFDGYYAQAAYLLTGEHRPYRHGAGVFGAPVPKRNFKWKGEDRGWGAWELALRYGSVDMTSGPIRGGRHDSLTLGLNWYLNPNARVYVNYIYNDIDHDLYRGSFDILQTRFQLEF